MAPFKKMFGKRLSQSEPVNTEDPDHDLETGQFISLRGGGSDPAPAATSQAPASTGAAPAGQENPYMDEYQA